MLVYSLLYIYYTSRCFTRLMLDLFSIIVNPAQCCRILYADSHFPKLWPGHASACRSKEADLPGTFPWRFSNCKIGQICKQWKAARNRLNPKQILKLWLQLWRNYRIHVESIQVKKKQHQSPLLVVADSAADCERSGVGRERMTTSLADLSQYLSKLISVSGLGLPPVWMKRKTK